VSCNHDWVRVSRVKTGEKIVTTWRCSKCRASRTETEYT
jgi:Zn-dependent alcohol dehydrogenase